MIKHRIFLFLLGLSISGIGGLFVFLMWQSYSRAVDQRSWPQVEGVILASETRAFKHDPYSPTEYQLKLLYGYEWAGKAMTGEQLSVRGNPSYNKRAKIDSLVKKYSPGGKVRVCVNPDDHRIAILKTDSKAAGYTIWFPLLFVIGGLGILTRSFFIKKA
jgi:Protein of unknown function (DUF3592)